MYKRKQLCALQEHKLSGLGVGQTCCTMGTCTVYGPLQLVAIKYNYIFIRGIAAVYNKSDISEVITRKRN